MFLDYVWLIVLALTLLLEVLTVQLVSIWFSIGAIFAEICALLKFSMPIQISVFIGISVLCLFIFYPLLNRNLRAKKQHFNADSVINEEGIVIEDINNLAGTGQVKVKNQVWSANTTDINTIVLKNSIVKVKAINGVKLLVEKIEK